MPELLQLGTHQLRFVEHPLYHVAHPGEEPPSDERCTKCAVAERPDTGERVLLWQCEGKNWTISRHDPEWARHRAELFTEGAERPALAS